MPRVRGGGVAAPGGRAATALLILLTLASAVPARAGSTLEEQLESVGSVELRGRHSVDAKEITSVLKTRRPSIWPWADRAPLRNDFLKADTASIALVYRQHGFLDVQVRDSVVVPARGRSVRVLFLIREGAQAHIASIAFEGVHAVPEANLRHGLYARPGRPFNPAFLIADTALIARQLGDRGYLPHVVGAARRDPLDSLQVHVLYVVDEGPLYHVGQTLLVTPGQPHVPEDAIRRELTLKPGAVYRISRVQESQERLYDTGLFQEVQISPLPDSSNTLMEFYVQLRERKTRWFDAGVGSGTQERFQFTGEWGDRNLRGSALRLVLGGRVALDKRGDFLYARGEAALIQPWVFGFRNWGAVRPYYERRRDFQTDTLKLDKEAPGVTFQLRRDFTRKTWLLLTQDNTFVLRQRVHFKQPGLPDSVKQALLKDFPSKYSTHRLQLSGQRDVRDNPLLPGRGSLQLASAEVAGQLFTRASSFTKFEASFSWYRPVRSGTWVLASRVRGGIIKPFAGARNFVPGAGVDPEVARVPTENAFRLGGVNTVRGHDENTIAPTGGLTLMLANVELRVPLWGLFGLELYLDAGNVWSRPEYIRADDFRPRLGSAPLAPGDVRYVYGVGGRFNLPFGPLRLDYTWGAGDLRHNPRAQFAIGPCF